MPPRTSQVAAPAAASFDGWEESSKQDLASKSFTKRVFKDVEDGDYRARLTIKKSDTSKKNPKTPATCVSMRYQLADDASQVQSIDLWFNHPKDDKFDADKQKKTTERLVRVLQTLGVNTKGVSPTAAIKSACEMCNPYMTVGIHVKNNEDPDKNEKWGPSVFLNEVLPNEEVVEEGSDTFEDDDQQDADEGDVPTDDEDLAEYEEEEQEAPVPAKAPPRKASPKTPAVPPRRR